MAVSAALTQRAAMEKARCRLGIDTGRFVVLQLGRMAPHKGIDTVIRGLAMLRERHGVDAELIVASSDLRDPSRRGGPELARLRAVAADLGVTPHVRFSGQPARAALGDYYGAADAIASMPWRTRLGITTTEAMACGRPVVGSDAYAVRDGVTGYLIPSRDAEALAERLARLHRHPALALAMGKAGRAILAPGAMR
ncbi:glycosyltransferase [Massilia niastensis]|uniref:glycosyltransferase n=1 Tax=Massilia niastensis TaxID=544911 RepID=UPI0003738E21|nr:glycosyltransferase [Massilia niastensis]